MSQAAKLIVDERQKSAQGFVVTNMPTDLGDRDVSHAPLSLQAATFY
jgi:hypothetical protein